MLGLVAPFLTFLALGTVIYLVRKPRVSVAFEEGPRAAEIGPGGEPVFPVGLPYCRRDGLVYPSGTHRCETCHDQLAVICPMCGLGRSALIDTCSNCGLVLKVKPRSMVVARSTGPKPGRRGGRLTSGAPDPPACSRWVSCSSRSASPRTSGTP